MLSDFQVTVPELGTIKARAAADRRHHHQPHARDPRRAEAALSLSLGRLSRRRARIGDRAHARCPASRKKLSARDRRLRAELRKEDLFKVPGVAETLDWAGALTELDVVALDPETVSDTLGVLLKYQDDIARLDGEGRRCSTRSRPSCGRRSSDRDASAGRSREARSWRTSDAGVPASPTTSSISRARCARPACRSGRRGARCDRGGAGRRHRHPRRFLLDAACGVREAARALDPVSTRPSASSAAAAS